MPDFFASLAKTFFENEFILRQDRGGTAGRVKVSDTASVE